MRTLTTFHPPGNRGVRVARGLALVVAVAGLSLGCEREERFVPVEGRVTLAGQSPYPGNVSFRPDPAKGNKSLHQPMGEFDEQGRYKLMTTGRPGAPPGWYKVLVFTADKVGDGPYGGPSLPKWKMNAKYLEEATTPLSVEVTDSPAPGAFDFEVSK